MYELTNKGGLGATRTFFNNGALARCTGDGQAHVGPAFRTGGGYPKTNELLLAGSAVRLSVYSMKE